ncbi:MAG: kdsD [Rickettsiaceae bacterium]|jgi:arabinose-5-phosphate isomerase|nr:kdsD [Rickettsiaceae bacterium]
MVCSKLHSPKNAQSTYSMANNQDKKSYLNSAKKTIEAEISGLNSLLEFFGDEFVKAVEIILQSNGRVIVSGMGKSGHIAAKIAATMASTGTAAFCVHPGEASHGDLGMITKDDVVILLSNSGETKELKDIIYYCKRFSIPLIGIVRRRESELTSAADVPLVLPDIPEASVIKAPTTSTTMMLALGDALAIALMEAKNFTNSDYGILHPGGKLGSEFIKVQDLMRKGAELPMVTSDCDVEKVLLEMTSKHLGCTGVKDEEENLVGIITDGDLRRHISKDFMNLSAKELMTKNPITIKESTLAVAAVALMNEKKITSLFVLNNKKAVGVLHIHDCLRAGVV